MRTNEPDCAVDEYRQCDFSHVLAKSQLQELVKLTAQNAAHITPPRITQLACFGPSRARVFCALSGGHGLGRATQ